MQKTGERAENRENRMHLRRVLTWWRKRDRRRNTYPSSKPNLCLSLNHIITLFIKVVFTEATHRAQSGLQPSQWLQLLHIHTVTEAIHRGRRQKMEWIRQFGQATVCIFSKARERGGCIWTIEKQPQNAIFQLFFQMEYSDRQISVTNLKVILCPRLLPRPPGTKQQGYTTCTYFSSCAAADQNVSATAYINSMELGEKVEGLKFPPIYLPEIQQCTHCSATYKMGWCCYAPYYTQDLHLVCSPKANKAWGGRGVRPCSHRRST